MAEWFKAAVLKTVVRKYRGFESYSLRHSFPGGGAGWQVLANETSRAQTKVLNDLRRFAAQNGEVAELA